MHKDRLKKLEADLRRTADKRRAKPDLKANTYFAPALGPIFLKFTPNNYRRHEAESLDECRKLKVLAI